MALEPLPDGVGVRHAAGRGRRPGPRRDRPRQHLARPPAPPHCLRSPGAPRRQERHPLPHRRPPPPRPPAMACDLHALPGAKTSSAFDITASCPGWLYSLAIAEGLIASGRAKTVLTLGAEKLSSVTDWTDRTTAVLFGDGAGAAVVRPAAADGRGILSIVLGADGELADLLYIPAGGSCEPVSEKVVRERTHFIRMAGREVFKAAVLAMAKSCDEALAKAGVTAAEIDLLVPHQANLRIIEATAKHAGLPMSKVMVNVDRYGNTSAASIPIAIDQALTEGRIRPGSLLMFVTFGAGFTWGSAVVRW